MTSTLIKTGIDELKAALREFLDKHEAQYLPIDLSNFIDENFGQIYSKFSWDKGHMLSVDKDYAGRFLKLQEEHAAHQIMERLIKDKILSFTNSYDMAFESVYTMNLVVFRREEQK